MNTILLGVKLLKSLIIFKLTKPQYFADKPLSLKRLVMGPLTLFQFIESTKTFIDFTTTSKQQKELIYWFFQTSSLIETGFGDKDGSAILTVKNFSDSISRRGGLNTENPLIQELTGLLDHLKKLINNDQNYNNFKSNIIKTWLTHKVRDSKEINNAQISFGETLNAGENRGGSYFLALIYLLGPKKINEVSKKIIQVSGAWFQLIDDYDDRKKDVGNRNTLFTISKTNLHQEIYKKYTLKYKNTIKSIGDQPKYPLIKFFRGLTGLVAIKSTFFAKFDWHDTKN